jgi:hypothetical protein
LGYDPYRAFIQVTAPGNPDSRVIEDGHCAGHIHPKQKRLGLVQIYCNSKTIPRVPCLRLQQLLDLDTQHFRHPKDILYFQEYVTLTQNPWIRAVSDGDLWEVTLPQLARNSGILRNAAMAIGAMSMWHRQSGNRATYEMPIAALVADTDDEHYLQAVAYYCRALRLQSQCATPQDMVFLSVFLLLFEILRDNRSAALNHLNHGLALFLDISTDDEATRFIDNIAPNPRPLLGAVADIYTRLAPEARMMFPKKIINSPPLPNLEKGLRCKKQTMESFLIFLSQLPGATISAASIDFDRVPTLFRNLNEFEEYWISFRRGQLALSVIWMNSMRESGILVSKDEAFITTCFTELIKNPRIRDFCIRTKESILAMDTAFSPLFKRIMSDPTSPQYLRALHLRLQFLVNLIFIDPSMYTHIDVAKSRTPIFREALSVVQIIMRHFQRENDNPAHQFSLQSEICSFLLAASFLCRDPLIRDEAMLVLKNYKGQDGLWSTRALYVLAKKNRTLERENGMYGTPSEQLQRQWRREFVFEDCGERIVFRFTERDQGTGKYHLVEEVADVTTVGAETKWIRRPLTRDGGLLGADALTLY